MKRVVCALVAVLLLMSAAGAEVSGNPLGLRALEKLTDGTENAAVSPVSLALALSMAREGAAGETLKELDELLAGEPIDVKALVRAGVRSANAGFVSPDYALLDDYMARVDAKWFEMGDDAMNQVNAWVEDMTDGLIPHILDNPPTDLTALYLVNALAMDEEWRIPFWEDGGYEDAFFAPSGEKSVDYMYVEDDFFYKESGGAQIIRLNYKDSSLAMYVVLPEDGGVPAVLAALSEQGFSYFDGMDDAPKVHLSLPKFSIAEGGSLLDALKALGMEISCSGDADFSRMCAEPLYIGDVIQKVRIDADEKGTKAAAATSIEMRAMALPPQFEEQPIEMKVERPFVAVIADVETGAVAFAAVVAEP